MNQVDVFNQVLTILTERQARTRVPEILEELVGASATVLAFRGQAHPPDLVIKVGTFTFVVEVKRSGDVAAVWRAAQTVRKHAAHVAPESIPLVAVPYMGERGRALCEETGIGWLDFSGNAHLIAPGLRVHVDGRENQFKKRGRPANVFAAMSSRLTRRLLLEAGQFISQRDLANSTGVDEGLTSRVIRKLEEDGLLARNAQGKVRPRDPGVLLDAWRETYEFEKHSILRGYMVARSGAELVRHLASSLTERKVRYAMTGLGAAWLATRFASFLTASLYLQEHPGEDLIEDLEFQQGERGANVWLIVPADDGVFDGEEDHEAIRCVSPIQVYLDLKGHPERAPEAAEHLRRELMSAPRSRCSGSLLLL